VCEQEPLTPVPSLGLLSFHWFVLSNSNVLVFFLTLYLMLLSILFLSPRRLYFLLRNRKEMDLDGREGEEELRRMEGVETIVDYGET